MSDAPWRTDPKYGGMSCASARASYEASLLRLPRPMPEMPDNARASDEEIVRRKAVVEDLLADYERAVLEAAEWSRGYQARHAKPAGFRAARRAAESVA